MKHGVALVVFTLGFNAACNSAGTVCAESIVYDEPIMRIAAVTDATSGASLSPVTISQIRLGAVDYAPAFFEPPPGLINAAVSDAQVLCNVVCAFGRTGGTYTFVVQANGYAAKETTINAKYARVSKGCEQHASGSTEVRVTLQRLQ